MGGVNGRVSGTREGMATGSSGARVDVVMGSGGEPYVTLAGPDTVCVRAVFGEPGQGSIGELGGREYEGGGAI